MTKTDDKSFSHIWLPKTGMSIPQEREDNFILQQTLALKYLTVLDFIVDFIYKIALIWLFSVRTKRPSV